MKESRFLQPPPLCRPEALASHDVASAVADAAADGAAGGEAVWRVPLEGAAHEAAARGDAPAALAARLLPFPPCGGAAMYAALALACATPDVARCGGGGCDISGGGCGGGSGGCCGAPRSVSRAAAMATAVAAFLVAVDAPCGDGGGGGGGGGEAMRARDCVEALHDLTLAAAAVPGAVSSLLRSGERGAAAAAAAAAARADAARALTAAVGKHARAAGAKRAAAAAQRAQRSRAIQRRGGLPA